MSDVTSEHFLFVSRYTCVCGGPVMIVPHVATDLDAVLVVKRHEQSREHRDYRARIERWDQLVSSSGDPADNVSVSDSPRSRLTSAGATSDREERVSSPPSRGGVSETPATWSLEDELWPGRVRS